MSWESMQMWHRWAKSASPSRYQCAVSSRWVVTGGGETAGGASCYSPGLQMCTPLSKNHSEQKPASVPPPFSLCVCICRIEDSDKDYLAVPSAEENAIPPQAWLLYPTANTGHTEASHTSLGAQLSGKVLA